jgi:hypothetical protein
LPGAGGGVAAFGVQELAGDSRDGIGQRDRCGSEVDADPGVFNGYLVGGQPADPGDGLGVEQDEQAGQPVAVAQCVVVQK